MSIGLGWKSWLPAGLLALASAVPAPQDAKVEAPRIDDFAWLAGGWKFEHGGMTTEENWIAPSGKTMLAVGRTVKGDATVFFEFLRLEARKDGSVVYVAHPAGRSPGTEFKLTKWDGHEAVFENPEHDFPTRIRYVKNDDGSLTASVEGERNGKPAREEFPYKRIAK
jgi:hypothetical protein